MTDVQLRPSHNPTRIYADRGARLSVYPTTVQGTTMHRVPRFDSGVRHDLERIRQAHADLGVDLPPDVVEMFARAGELTAELHAPQPDNSDARRAAASRIADGADVAKAVAAAVKAHDAARKAEGEERRRILLDAVDAVYRGIVTALHDHGDQLVLALRPAHDQALADPGSLEAAHRWNACHDLVASMRTLGLVPSAVGAQWLDLRFGRPDAVHRWQLDRCRRRRLLASETRGSRSRPLLIEQHVPLDPPPLALPEVHVHRVEWEPGLLTADEIVKAAQQIIKNDEATIAEWLNR